MTTVENNTFTGPNAGIVGGYVPLTTIESTSMDSDLDLVKDDLDYHLSILQAIYTKLDTIETGATTTPSASTMVSTINASAELIDADNLESTVALLSNIISDIEAHRIITTQSAMHTENSIKSTDQTYSYTPSSIVTSCQNILDEINNVRAQIHKILGQSTWIDVPNTTIAEIKTKLDTIATSANNYVHPTGDGNVHVPESGTTNNGRVLTATTSAGVFSWSDLPTVFGGVPAGMIAMWSGLIANIPVGWTLCNGNSGTPDLRAKFVRGAPDATEAGTTGGEDTHTLSIPEMPIHRHALHANPDLNTDYVAQIESRQAVNSTLANTGYAGGSEAHNNMPAYYEVLFIMKVSDDLPDTATSLDLNLVTKTTDYTAQLSDYTILCNATSGVITITLPIASGNSGRIFNIKKIDTGSNAVIIDGNSTELIDDELTYIIITAKESVTIQCTGSAWVVI